MVTEQELEQLKAQEAELEARYEVCSESIHAWRRQLEEVYRMLERVRDELEDAREAAE